MEFFISTHLHSIFLESQTTIRFFFSNLQIDHGKGMTKVFAIFFHYPHKIRGKILHNIKAKARGQHQQTMEKIIQRKIILDLVSLQLTT